MNRPTRDDLVELYRIDTGPLVSICLPTHRAGPETRQDPIRLKNLLREAAAQLESGGMDEEDAERLLAEGWKLVEDYQYWQHQEDGLALYYGPGVSQSFRLPATLPELAVVGDRFHLTPLLELLPGAERFHVLALSQEQVRLLAGDRYRIRDLEPEEVPESLRDVVGYDYEQKSLQFRSGVDRPASGVGRTRAMFHGHGAGEDDADEELTEFLRRVDQAVTGLIEPPRPPLVLAAVDRVAAAYRQLSQHGRVLSDFVEESPGRLSADELHHRAWPLAEAELSAPRREAWERFESLRHTERGGDELGEVVAAAVVGRVETLFVAHGEHRWGRFDAEEQTVETADSPQDGAVDLVGQAAIESILHGGALYVVPAEELGSAAPLAATYRY